MPYATSKPKPRLSDEDINDWVQDSKPSSTRSKPPSSKASPRKSVETRAEKEIRELEQQKNNWYPEDTVCQFPPIDPTCKTDP
jgi:hypothetical protein